MSFLRRIFTPANLFVLKCLGLYFLWQILYEFYLHQNSPVDDWVVNSLVSASDFILQKFGYVTFRGAKRLIGIDATSGLWIGDPCNGLTLFALFTGFIIAFPGPIKHKAWFIPSGILTIHLINIIRIVLLAIIQTGFSREVVEFNHTYTFTIFVYGIIMLMWVFWVKKLSSLNENDV